MDIGPSSSCLWHNSLRTAQGTHAHKSLASKQACKTRSKYCVSLFGLPFGQRSRGLNATEKQARLERRSKIVVGRFSAIDASSFPLEFRVQLRDPRKTATPTVKKNTYNHVYFSTFTSCLGVESYLLIHNAMKQRKLLY